MQREAVDDRSTPASSQPATPKDETDQWYNKGDSEKQNRQLAKKNPRGEKQRGGQLQRYQQQRQQQQMQQQQQQQPQKDEGGKNPLKLRLDLNLEIEITLKAKIHGDLTLALL
jgi:hypothetical protein